MPNLKRRQTLRGPNAIDAFIGARVQVRRRKLGMSQVTLGARIGVTVQQVQKYENAVNRISASALVRIADALEIAPAELLPDAPQVRPDDEYAACSPVKPPTGRSWWRGPDLRRTNARTSST